MRINDNFKLSSSFYLKRLDIINKYNLTSNFNFPEVSSIKLKLYSKDLMESSFAYSTKNKQNLALFRAMMILYILTGHKAALKCLNKKSFVHSKEAELADDNFVYELTLADSKEINSFLEKLKIETNFLKENLGSEKLNNITIQKNNVFTLNTQLMLSQFPEINDLAYANYKDFDLKKTVLNLNLLYKNIPKNLKYASNIAKNLW